MPLQPQAPLVAGGGKGRVGGGKEGENSQLIDRAIAEVKNTLETPRESTLTLNVLRCCSRQFTSRPCLLSARFRAMPPGFISIGETERHSTQAPISQTERARRSSSAVFDGAGLIGDRLATRGRCPGPNRLAGILDSLQFNLYSVQRSRFAPGFRPTRVQIKQFGN